MIQTVEINDNELLYMIRMKDDSALDFLIHKYYQDVQFSISRNIKSTFRMLERDDFYQIALVKLMEAIETYREDSDASFRTFYLQVLRYSFFDRIRRDNSKQALYEKKYIEYNPQIHESSSYYVLSDTHEQQKELLVEVLSNESKEFTDLEKEIIALRGHGFTYKEIAKYYQVDIKKVDNTLRKIRKYGMHKVQHNIH